MFEINQINIPINSGFSWNPFDVTDCQINDPVQKLYCDLWREGKFYGAGCTLFLPYIGMIENS